jgi:hypothetical protein
MIVKNGDGCWENYNAKHFEIILKFIGKKKRRKEKLTYALLNSQIKT